MGSIVISQQNLPMFVTNSDESTKVLMNVLCFSTHEANLTIRELRTVIEKLRKSTKHEISKLSH